MEEPWRDSGEPVPSVNVGDLKSAWDIYCEMESRHGPDVAVAGGTNVIERACSPGADVRAVAYRCAMLKLLEALPGERMAPWKQSGQFQEAVFRVAATIPMTWIGEGLSHSWPFDVDAFFEQLREESP